MSEALDIQNTLDGAKETLSQMEPEVQHLSRGSIKTTQIAMGGTQVKVRTDATPAALKQIRDLVDHKFEEYAEKLKKGVSAHQLTVLVAFNLAEELLREREKNRVFKRKMTEWADRLISRVESYLNKN